MTHGWLAVKPTRKMRRILSCLVRRVEFSITHHQFSIDSEGDYDTDLGGMS